MLRRLRVRRGRHQLLQRRHQGPELLRVKEHSPERALKKIASFFGYPETTYHVSDADGTRIGGIRKLFGERTYHVSDAFDTDLMNIVQEFESIPNQGASWMAVPARSVRTRSLRVLARRPPDRLASTGPLHQTESTIDMTLDSEHLVDRRLSLAVMCLDLLRARDEGCS